MSVAARKYVSIVLLMSGTLSNKIKPFLTATLVVDCSLLTVHAGDAFQSLQSSFLDKHYAQFEETEENKFIYSDIHQEYVSMMLQCCWQLPSAFFALLKFW